MLNTHTRRMLKHRLLHRDHGFTLAELLVVVVILVVLAALAVPLFLGQVGKAKDARAKTNVANAAQLLGDARGTNGSATYNPTTRVLTTEFGGSGGAGMSVPMAGIAGETTMTMPTSAKVYSDDTQITAITTAIDLDAYCVTDTGVHTYRMGADDSFPVEGTGPCPAGGGGGVVPDPGPGPGPGPGGGDPPGGGGTEIPNPDVFPVNFGTQDRTSGANHLFQAVDSSGNSYYVGDYKEWGYYGGSTTTVIALTKISPDGTVIWTRPLLTTNEILSSGSHFGVRGIAYDASDNSIVISGYQNGIEAPLKGITIASGAISYWHNAFVGKVSTSDASWTWMSHMDNPRGHSDPVETAPVVNADGTISVALNSFLVSAGNTGGFAGVTMTGYNMNMGVMTVSNDGTPFGLTYNTTLEVPSDQTMQFSAVTGNADGTITVAGSWWSGDNSFNGTILAPDQGVFTAKYTVATNTWSEIRPYATVGGAGIGRLLRASDGKLWAWVGGSPGTINFGNHTSNLASAGDHLETPLVVLNPDGTWLGEVNSPNDSVIPFLAALPAGKVAVGGVTNFHNRTFGTKTYPDLGALGAFVGVVNSGATDYEWIAASSSADNAKVAGLSAFSNGVLTVGGVSDLRTNGGNSTGGDWFTRVSSNGQWW